MLRKILDPKTNINTLIHIMLKIMAFKIKECLILGLMGTNQTIPNKEVQILINIRAINILA